MPRPSDPNAKIRLLGAAEAVFAEHGLDRAKVEEITARAGLSKGAFYLHFASKEDAFRQLVESIVARLRNYVDSAVCEDIPTESVEAALERWVDKDTEMFEFVWSNRGVMRLLLDGGKSANFRYLVDEFAEGARQTTQKHLALGIERGLYRPDLDVSLASAFIAGAYDRIARQIVRMPKKPDLRAITRSCQLLVIRGIASDATLEATDSRVTARPSPAAPAPSRLKRVASE